MDLPPTDPRYDAFELKAQDTGALTARQIFESEPRDPAQAPIFERRIQGTLASAIDELGLTDKVIHVDVECHTLSCATRLEVAPGDVGPVYDALNGIMLGDAQEPGMDPTGAVIITNLYRADARADSYHERFLAEATRPAIEAAKQRAGSGTR